MKNLSALSSSGLATTPHYLASESAASILREGGNAIEAMIAAAATIAVAYPHMNSIGGDSFWLLHESGKLPVAIDACGAAAQAASLDWYRERGMAYDSPNAAQTSIGFRGPTAACTVAGTISGWQMALEYSQQHWQGKLPLSRLLSDAIGFARNGVPVTQSQASATTSKQAELHTQPGFAPTFLSGGAAPFVGSIFRQPLLANTLEHLVVKGLGDYYHGELGRAIGKELQRLGSPLSHADLSGHRAQLCKPLVLHHAQGLVYNFPPPTQGLVSLLILGVLDRLNVGRYNHLSADYIHLAVEATKRAFAIRDHYITDPAYMKTEAQHFLEPAKLDKMAASIDLQTVLPTGKTQGPGDTVWMGVMDAQGRSVSMIQSIYHEFGCGIVLRDSGINWQNRGVSFSLNPNALNALQPGRKPFHTLNPALAVLNDGRTMVYGNMGGDGQPQSQAAVFTRIVHHGLSPADAIAAPRWLLGRAWGNSSESLKLESRFDTRVIDDLKHRGHDVEVLKPFDELMGHAGAIVRDANGNMIGGADPRSDGSVVG